MKFLRFMFVMCTCVTLVTGCGKKKEDVKEPVKEKQTEKAKLENFEFTTNSVNFENNNSVFDIKVKNIANEEKYINEFIIHVKDSNGETIGSLFGNVNENIEPQGERVITCSFGGNLSNYSSLEFEIL